MRTWPKAVMEDKIGDFKAHTSTFNGRGRVAKRTRDRMIGNGVIRLNCISSRNENT